MYPGNGGYTYNNSNNNNGYSNGNNGYNGNGYSRPAMPPPAMNGNNQGNYVNQGYAAPSLQQYSTGYRYANTSNNNTNYQTNYSGYSHQTGTTPQNLNNPDYSGAPSNYAKPNNLQAPPSTPLSFNGNITNQQYQYSQCTGRRKALIIGINYIGTQNELRGCINDAHNIFNFLTTKYGYASEDIVILTDDQTDLVRVPTRANMIRAMQWLVKDAQPDDSLFFHYSGHGGQTEDLDGDEESGFDSTIYPVDFQVNGHIVDDEMHDIMVKTLQPGTRLTALFDSCHSGTALDLPYVYSTKGVVKEPNMWKDVGGDGLQAAMAYAVGDRTRLVSSLGSIFNTVKRGMSSNIDREKVKQVKFSAADVVMLSGSKDNQTSADATEDGQNTGAMSYAFIKCLTLQPLQSYLSLLQNMRQELSSKYTQKPQLSASHPMDVNLQFIM